MLISRTLLEHIHIRYSYQALAQAALILIVLAIIFQASWQMLQPIKERQYSHVIQLSQQATFPHTQTLAKELLQRIQINQRAYLRLVAAQQEESAAIQYYPAVDETP